MGVGKRKLASGVKWRFFGSHKGRKFYSKAIYDSRAEALKAEKEFLIELASGIVGTKLRDLAEERLEELRLYDCSDKYLAINRRYFDMMLAAFGNIAVTSITKPMMRKLINTEAARLQRNGKTYHKANDLIRITKAFFNYVIDTKDVDMRNPVKGIKMFPIFDPIKYIPTGWDIMMVKGNLDLAQIRLLEFCEETGCRVSEALKLEMEHINEDYIMLSSRKSKDSNLARRWILKPEVLDVMKAEGELPEKGLIFGKRWTTYPKFLPKLTRQLSKEPNADMKPWGWHNLRHRATVMWAEQGIDIYQIMRRLGHSSVMVTMKYMRGLGIHDPEKPKPVVRRTHTIETIEGDLVEVEYPLPGRKNKDGQNSQNS